MYTRSLSWLASLLVAGLLPTVASGQIMQEAYVKPLVTDVEDQFGTSIALDGDTLIVGCPSEDSGSLTNAANNSILSAGAAYIFARVGTTWQQQAYLKSPAADIFDQFGYAVTVSGDTVVVGARFEDSSAVGVNGDPLDNSVPSSGAAYVFTRTGTTWVQEAYLKATPGGEFDQFGVALSLDGDRLVVGAESESSSSSGVNGAPDNDDAPIAGAAYVFERTGSTWAQTTYLKASNPGNADWFGGRVDVSGDTIVVGARGEDNNATDVDGPQGNTSASFSGAAYVFVIEGGTWTQQAYLKSNVTMPNGNFGIDVDIDQDTIVVGGLDFANVFRRSGSTWSPLGRLTLPIAPVPDEFGRAVAIHGDLIAVGAAHDSGGPGINGDMCFPLSLRSGAVFLYRDAAGGFELETYINPTANGDGDRFGTVVALDGDRLAVSADSEDSGVPGVNVNPLDDSSPDAGAAYLFDLASNAVHPAEPTCTEFLEACHGDGGDQLGCTDCPCNNGLSAGIVGGCSNSAGTPGVLLYSGSSSLSLNDLRFNASGLPVGITAVLTSGQSLAPQNPSNPCFGQNSGIGSIHLDGLRCVVSNVVRHGARQSDASGDVGQTNAGWGAPAPILGSFAFVSGGARHFQLLYRDDPAANCMTGQNTSQAVTVRFRP